MRTLAGLLLVTLFISACGRKGPLIYPDMLAPAAPTSVTARQAGQAMKLSFVLPQKDRAGHGLKNLAGVTIFKRSATMSQGPECKACSEDYALFKKLYLDIPLTDSSVQRYGNQIVLLDSDVRGGDEYSYTVTTFTKVALEGQTSLPVTTGMFPPPLAPSLKVVSEPTEVQLTFSGSSPEKGTFLGYNIYRALKGEAMPFQPLNKEPLNAKSYVDIGIARNTSYVYVARTVVRMPGGELVESEPSNEVVAQLANE